ncbi:MAG: recombinase family protein [Gammaproteobacteria bacterium]|nr:recombinase family protein [Gammaproteobacteria bacterium]
MIQLIHQLLRGEWYLVFLQLFGEFERELIRERTQAGLKSARARGGKGGRPNGISQTAMEKARIAEALYKNGSIMVVFL